jgi:cell division ATPase FtsA
VSIADLPDQSTFSKTVNEKFMDKVMEGSMSKVMKMVEYIIKKYKNVKEILLTGGSAKLPLFEEGVRQISNRCNGSYDRKILHLRKLDIWEGMFTIQK